MSETSQVHTSSIMGKENDPLFENVYKCSYNSRFLPKEICRKCYDTAVQMSSSCDETRYFYDDIVDFAIDLLNLKKELR